jgi:hypothetical protein
MVKPMPARPGTTVFAAVLALAGVAALLVAALNQQPAPPSPPSTEASTEASTLRPAGPSSPSEATTPAPSAGPGAAVDNSDRVKGPVLRQARPTHLRIPGIDVSTGLVPLGLDSTGAMETPSDPATAGWYTKAPTPGALGPAVIAGHVTWNRVPAVFFRLGDLRRGDRIEVGRRDGRTAVFEVRRVSSFAKSRFPTEAVYGPTDHAALRLITCGGEYDEQRSRYADNVVVFAALVGVRRH